MIRRPVLTLLVALFAAAAAAAIVARLRIDTSLAALFNRDDSSARAMLAVLADFKSADELLILATTPAPTPQPAPLVDFARRFETSLANDAEAAAMSDGVIYRADAQTRAFIEQVVVPNGIFYLDDNALDVAKKRFTRDEMINQIRRNETLISTPGPAAQALAKTILKDPLHLHEFLLDRLASALPIKSFDNGAGDGAFLSPDGRSILIRIRGKKPVSDLEFSKHFTAAMQRLTAAANSDHLELEFSGGYAIAAASERAIRHDMIGTVIGSVISLQLLFILAYRRSLRSFLLAFLPIAIGTLYGFGVYALLARNLTPMTATIGGILAGMAIDYAINFLSFYHARRTTEPDAVSAALAARKDVARAIVAAWATSIVGFVAIGSSHVQALRDFSLLGSIGLTGAFLASIFILPPLLVILDKRPPRSSESRFPIDPLLRFISAHARGLVAITAVAFSVCVIALLIPGPILPLESDLTVMHPRPNPALDAQTHIAQLMGSSPGSLVIHLTAVDPNDLITLAHKVDVRLRSAEVKSCGVTGVFSLASLLPDPSTTQSRLAIIGPAYADRVIADFRAAVADSMFDAKAYEPYESFLRRMLTATRAPGIDDLLRYPALADNILPKSAFAPPPPQPAPPTESIALIFLDEASEHRESRDRAIAAIRAAVADLPGVTLTGLSVLNHDTELAVRRDLPRLIVIALVIVTLYLAVHFRNLRNCILAMLPTLFSMACLLAFMRLANVKLNMINLVAFPLLIGIDVDYGIFLVTAARRRDRHDQETSIEDLREHLAPGTRAVLLCAAATTLGFGSLAFTSVPAVQSLGVAVAVGIVACVAGAFFASLSILFMLAPRDRGKT